MSKGCIVIVDDDKEMRSLLADFFKSDGYDVHPFSNAIEALNALRTPEPSGLHHVDVIVSDIKMPQMDGLQFTHTVKSILPDVPVILITAFGSIETAIEAMKKGAFHYVMKPFKLAEMAVNVDRALEHRKLKQDVEVLRSEVQQGYQLGGIVGKSQGMQSVFDLVKRVAVASANVLITGESGTGKEMIARAIHDQGNRSKKPFVAINCTAIPDTLLESELFGHAKGSFTGAINRKKGLFEEADGGTLFLDEIGDMNPQLQSKLLRVIQEKKIRAVGENITKDIDVRIIAATHKDLKLAIRDGHFREDLFYRLSVIPITLPPLRQRKEDIPILAEYFLKKAAASNRSLVRGFTKRAMTKLMNARWEGNVRELENVIERAVVLAQGQFVDDQDLPSVNTMGIEEFFGQAASDLPTLEQLEKRYMTLVLQKVGGRKEKASQILGINRRTLYRKEREYGLISADESEELVSGDSEKLG